jgi:uncharacterized protein YceH (UPF0502 family)
LPLSYRSCNATKIGVEQKTLAPLIERGFVRRLPPLAGSRAERYAQLMCPDLHPLDAPVAVATERSVATQPASGLVERLEALESEVARLRRQVQRLAERSGTDLEAD